MAETVRLAVDDRGWARITFDQPGSRVNLLSSAVLEELHGHLTRLAGESTGARGPDPAVGSAASGGPGPAPAVRVLVIESAKAGCFLAGADINEIQNLASAAETEERVALGQTILGQIEALPFPSVAVIDGVCLGGGLELALCCTYRIVTDDPKTRLGLPEVTLGIIPGFGGTQRLPRLVGPSQALDLILSGRQIDAKRAERVHLADARYPREFLPERLEAFVGRILSPRGAAELLARRRVGRRALLEGNPLGRALLFSRVRRELLARSGGHYPAPLIALETVKHTYRSRRLDGRGRYAGSLDRGLARERRSFASLSPGEVSRNLVGLFFTSEALKKEGWEGSSSWPQERGTAGRGRRGVRPGEGGPSAAASAGVLGAGVMGGGIAWLFASQGLPVRMKDVSWEAIAKGYSSASHAFDELVRRKRIEPRVAGLQMHRLSGGIDWSGFASVDVVIEAIVERVAAKQQALAELEGRVRPEALLATNTSSLSVSEIARGLKLPERFAGMHFFNPVNRMPLVEVIPGEQTAPQTVAALVALAKRLGKTPILVRDRPGFLVNRVLLAYLSEATLLFERGVDFGLIDRTLEEFGMPMGPFALIDEIGHDIAFEVAKSLAAAFAGRFPLPHALEVLREERGLLGRKGGAGFYRYPGHGRRPNPTVLAAFPGGKRMSPEEIRDRCLLAMVNEAARCLDEGIIDRVDYLDMAFILGIGFPPFRGGILRYADAYGVARVVERLEALRKSEGERFAPAELLVRTAEAGGSLYAAPSHADGRMRSAHDRAPRSPAKRVAHRGNGSGERRKGKG